MQLTSEQQAILQTSGNLKINAVAGSGKTTTVIEYARTRPTTAKILYLAFNKSVKIEAQKKFADRGLKNVIVETAHSLAFRNVVPQNNYQIRKQGYKTYEIPELLGIESSNEKHYEYILANHINKFVTYFCNSDKEKVQELNYLDIVFDRKAKIFVTACYPQIEKYTREFLAKMNAGKIEVTHDFYLKKFQLSNPKLDFDYILFDEAQDASAAMLSIVLRQNANKIIVGDVHQQIYGWRHAVNSLESVDYPIYQLTTSFRFKQDIANLAMQILEWKNNIKENQKVLISGVGNSSEVKTKAMIARTNLGLLLMAIQKVTEAKKVPSIYFEGNINSYTYADDGTSLYDVLNLYLGKRQLIRDKLIKSMKDIAELVDYMDKTEDLQLAMIVNIVTEYGDQIPGIINKIKNAHVTNEEKATAEIIFSTVHRCKGMEYDSIQLANDFISEQKLLKLIQDNKEADLDINRINEEINLLYVAVTRTKNLILIPEEIFPSDVQKPPGIYIEKKNKKPENKPIVIEKLENKIRWNWDKLQNEFEKNSEIAQNVDKKPKSWTKEMDNNLSKLFFKGKKIEEIAESLGKTKDAVGTRIVKLGLNYKILPLNRIPRK